MPTPTVIGPNDLTFLGRYRWGTLGSGEMSMLTGSRAPIAYSAARDLWYSCGNLRNANDAINSYSIIKLTKPTAPPSLSATSTNWPAFTATGVIANETGYASIQLDMNGSSADQINGLWVDDAEDLLYVSYSDTYGATTATPGLFAVELNGSGTCYGPWFVNLVSARRGCSQVQAAPAAIQALTGHGLIAFGFRDSSGQNDPNGPSFYSIAKPTRATTRAVKSGGTWSGGALDNYTILHFTRIQTGDTTGDYSHYPWPYDWYWTERAVPHGSGGSNYNQGPYTIKAEPAVAGVNIFPASFAFNHGCWIDTGDKWGVMWLGLTGAPGNLCVYGADNEMGDPNQTQQVFKNEAGATISRPLSVAQFPDGQNPNKDTVIGSPPYTLNGYLHDTQGGVTGPHNERIYPTFAFYDPQDLIDAAPGVHNPATAGVRYLSQEIAPSTAAVLVPGTWTDYTWTNSWILPGSSATAKQQTGGVYFDAANRLLYVSQPKAYSSGRPVINVFQITSSGAGSNTTIAPLKGAITATGKTPTATVSGGSVAPTKATRTLTGATPTRTVADTRSPAKATRTLSGKTPTRTQADTRSPSNGAAVLTGSTVVRLVADTRSPAKAAGALTGIAPTVTRTANVLAVPAKAALVATGATPDAVTIYTPDHVQAPARAARTLSGGTPALREAWAVAPAKAALAASGAAPVRLVAETRSPASAAHTLAGGLPTIDWAIPVPAATATIAGAAPTLSAFFTVTRQTLALTGATPAANVGEWIDVPGGSCGIEGMRLDVTVAITNVIYDLTAPARARLTPRPQ